MTDKKQNPPAIQLENIDGLTVRGNTSTGAQFLKGKNIKDADISNNHMEAAVVVKDGPWWKRAALWLLKALLPGTALAAIKHWLGW